MKVRPSRIFDTSTLIDLFNGHRELGELLNQAESGTWPGTIAARRVVHEASVVRGVVVTRSPGDNEGRRVSLLVV